MGEFNSDDHCIYSCGQESLRKKGVAITVNKRVWQNPPQIKKKLKKEKKNKIYNIKKKKKRVWNAVLECNLKNDRMISVHFLGKPFNIRVI